MLYMLSRLIFTVTAILSLLACSNQEPPVLPAKVCLSEDRYEMVWISGGIFVMGENPRYPEEGPPQTVHLDGFWISNHEVTNAEFRAFVDATNYVTETERLIGNHSSNQVAPGGAVFGNQEPNSEQSPSQWSLEEDATWKRPQGQPDNDPYFSSKPVVQVTLSDAKAYADWRGMALPTEVQWEYAAKSQTDNLEEPVSEDAQYLANYYQGMFPFFDQGLDGYTSRAPVGCFPANEQRLHDMIGNVWEWTVDPAPDRPGFGVIKGGSFLCSKNYCSRYRSMAREFQELTLGAEHLGFRLVDNSHLPPM